MGHKVIVAKVDKVIAIEGATNVQVAVVLGEQVVVSKDMQEGYVGLFFPVDVQIAKEYAHKNNLNRDSSKNSDNNKKGFFDTNLRVRAQLFLKVKSQGYFAPLDSLAYTGKTDFVLGEQFDEINGVKICQKYISEKTKEAIAKQSNPKQAKKNYAPLFAKHVDSDQFKHFAQSIPEGAILYFHAKVHGTSHRSGKTFVSQEVKWHHKLINKFFGKKVYDDQKMDFVVGTRNVVLKAGDDAKEGFHGTEQFRFDVAKSVEPFLEDGMLVYGEIAGYVNGKNVMPEHDVKALKDKRYTKKYGDKTIYKYGCKEHEYRFHIYRITRLTQNGDNIDMSQAQLDKWIKDRGLLGPVEVHKPFVYNGDVEALRVLVDELTERPDVLTEDYIDPCHISEGIIIRVENGNDTPKFYKNKSYAFRVMEGITESVDTEDAA